MSYERQTIAVLGLPSQIEELAELTSALRARLPEAGLRFASEVLEASAAGRKRSCAGPASAPGWIDGVQAAVVPVLDPWLVPTVTYSLTQGVPIVSFDSAIARALLSGGAIRVSIEAGAEGLAAATRQVLGDPGASAGLIRRGRAQANRLRRGTARWQEETLGKDLDGRPSDLPRLASLPHGVLLSAFRGDRCVARFYPGGAVPFWEEAAVLPGCRLVAHRGQICRVEDRWPAVRTEALGAIFLSPCAEVEGGVPLLPPNGVLLVTNHSVSELLTLMPYVRALHRLGCPVALGCRRELVSLFTTHDSLFAVMPLDGSWPVGGRLLDLRAETDPVATLRNFAPPVPRTQPELCPPVETRATAQRTAPDRFAAVWLPSAKTWTAQLIAAFRAAIDELRRHLPVLALSEGVGFPLPAGVELICSSLAARVALASRAVCLVGPDRGEEGDDDAAAIARDQNVPFVALTSNAEAPLHRLRTLVALSAIGRRDPKSPPLVGLPEGWHLHVFHAGHAPRTRTGLGQTPITEALLPHEVADHADITLTADSRPHLRRDWPRVRIDGVELLAWIDPNLRRPWSDPCPAAQIPRLGDPEDRTLHVLAPAGIGDFAWIWMKLWSVARDRPVKFWFPDGEQHRAGRYAELVGAAHGFLPGLTTDWVWRRPGAPVLPDRGWVSLHANRHLESGGSLRDWYPKLPLACPHPQFAAGSAPARATAYVFIGSRTYMEGNLPVETWAKILAKIETVMPVTIVGAGSDVEYAEAVLTVYGRGSVKRLNDRPIAEILAAAASSALVVGLAGGPTISALCLGVPSVLAYPGWLDRMPGTWEPPGSCWDWCFVSDLEEKTRQILADPRWRRLIERQSPTLLWPEHSASHLRPPASIPFASSLQPPASRLPPPPLPPPTSSFHSVGSACPLCGGLGDGIGTKGGIELRSCCGTLLAWGWPNEDEYNRWYREGEQYHREQQLAEGQMPYGERDAEHREAAAARLAIISALYPEVRRILDVGAGTGAFVAVAAGRGFQACGLDPNGQMVATAGKLGRVLLPEGWESLDPAIHGRWHLVTMHDVFEHVTRPAECLARLRSILTDRGLLCIEMPEWDCPEARLQQLEWRHVRPRQHVCLYSEAAARELFRRNGLETIALVRPRGGNLGKAAYFLREV